MMAQMDGSPVFYDWLTRSGSVYVDTGYKIPDGGVIYVSSIFGQGGSNREIIGISDGTYKTYIRQVSASGIERIGAAYAGGSEAAKNFGNYYNPEAEFDLWLTPSKCGYGDMASPLSITSGGNYPDSTLCVFEVPDNSGTQWEKRIGAIYVYGSEAAGISGASDLASYTPVASFVPCKMGSKVSYYHLEQNRLCQTIGSGKFIPSNRI